MNKFTGQNQFKFKVDTNWAKLPEGWTFKEVGGVGVDSKDRVYVFNRGEHPLIVFDREGNFLKSWGEGLYPRAHGVTMGPDDSIYLTDDGNHSVRKCNLNGDILMTLGSPGESSNFMSGKPFNRCTHVALDPNNGDIYVSDGYGNSKVHKYSPDGKLLFSWGESGTGPGEFNLVHNIATDRDGYVYVADRENHRVQVFDKNGNFETQWKNLHRPCGIFIDNQNTQTCYIAELGATMAVNINYPNIGPRVVITDLKGNILEKLGNDTKTEVTEISDTLKIKIGPNPTEFTSPHTISVDSSGDIYVGEVSWTTSGQHLKPPREIKSFQKLIKL